MRVLIVSHLWPRRGASYLGTWVPDQIRSLARHCDISVAVPVDRTIRREELIFHELLTGFKNYRHRSHPALTPLQGISIDTVPYFGIIPRKVFATATAKNLARSLNQIPLDGIDLVHVHTLFPDGLACALWLADKNIPLVATTHSNDVLSDLGNLKKVLRTLFRRANALIVVCRAQGKALETLGADPNKIHIIPNGFLKEDYERINDTHRSPTKIAYLGRLHFVKRVDLLIRALAECSPEISLDIGGDGPEQRNLESLVKRLGLMDRIRFRGSVLRADVPQFLAGVALLCLVSNREGWPTVIHEALACGTPVLATVVGGVPEALADPRLGALLPANISPEKLAETIESSLKNNWDRGYIKRHAFRYTWEEITIQLVSTYRSLLNPRGP